MATVASLWIGERLGMIEKASIRSFGEFKHEVQRC